MKLVLIALVFSLTPFVVSAHTSPVIPPDLTSALSKGDVSTISSYFADQVEIKIGTESKTLAKADATTQIREFFAGHQAQSFKPMMTSGSAEKATAEVGELVTSNGKYRVSVQLTNDQKPKITALRFEQ